MPHAFKTRLRTTLVSKPFTVQMISWHTITDTLYWLTVDKNGIIWNGLEFWWMKFRMFEWDLIVLNESKNLPLFFILTVVFCKHAVKNVKTCIRFACYFPSFSIVLLDLDLSSAASTEQQVIRVILSTNICKAINQTFPAVLSSTCSAALCLGMRHQDAFFLSCRGRTLGICGISVGTGSPLLNGVRGTGMWSQAGGRVISRKRISAL